MLHLLLLIFIVSKSVALKDLVLRAIPAMESHNPEACWVKVIVDGACKPSDVHTYREGNCAADVFGFLCLQYGLSFGFYFPSSFGGVAIVIEDDSCGVGSVRAVVV
ncbi:uncharacterized protein G2W53_009029 [Senna tora]|uniref:Uncharacterized protein n=1 Tax=Senna tora TaxID=362788 RepID=A0A834WWP1_9FABA|nr:uncharacterized protein G2W53_009029 [Senna tora]